MSAPDLPAAEHPRTPRWGGHAGRLAVGIVGLVALLAGGATAYVLFRPGTTEPQAAATSHTTATPSRTRPAPTPPASFTPYAGPRIDLLVTYVEQQYENLPDQFA